MTEKIWTAVLITGILLCHQQAQSQSLAPEINCPGIESMDRLLAFDDVFFGEIHGTNETPALFRCLIDRALEASRERVIVSLELPSGAREPDDKFWQRGDKGDGRNSRAMFALVMYLVELEHQALLNLHFQHQSRIAPLTKPRTETIADELNALAARGKLIALAGNMHSMNHIPEAFRLGELAEGRYLDKAITTINLSSAKGGEFWAMLEGVKKMQPREDARPGTLTDGRSIGHDYIYYLEQERSTASLPMKVLLR